MTNLDQLPVAALPALPLPILQVNGAASPTTTSDGSIGLLLVDDNHHHRIPLLAALRKQGYWVLHAAGGDSAETLSRKSSHPIQVLVAREKMKGMNGAELARRLTRQRPDLRVLLMRHPIDRPALEGAEPANTVEKPGGALIEDPFTPAELCDRVADVLASTGSGSEKVVHAIA